MSIVLYHRDADGFCSAWVASQFLPPDTEYIGVQYGEDPPWVAAEKSIGEWLDGRDLYIFDFSYKRTKMNGLVLACKNEGVRLVCLDHHKTAEKELDGVPGCRFDMNRAGCKMTLDYFVNKMTLDYFANGLPVAPLAANMGADMDGGGLDWVVAYVQDRDLWRFELPHSEEYNMVVFSTPWDFKEWNALSWRSREDVWQEGAKMIRYRDATVELILKHARIVELGGHKVWAVNTPVLQSETAGALAKKPLLDGSTPSFGIAWFCRADGKFIISLRSRGDFDVSELARNFGGGGHPASAGFETDFLPPWWFAETRKFGEGTMRILEQMGDRAE